ncbi:hypothetical protein P8815_18130 [Bacillus altitudinis]|uniref:hypothetical protein n=1 Tax=Bacillus TaxID=1386 RepID=UPI000260A9BC|nr:MULTISPECIES: hypothetical protein [Bacillus]EIL83369.1 hypothetical protein BAME_34330 [Bacillus sp. M 2-6]MEC0473659.1 hypothetical protein [Bacillus altitudinis]
MKLFEISHPYFALIRARNMDKAMEIYNEALLESNLAESDTDNVIREISKKHAVRSFLSIVGFEKGYLKDVILEGKKEGVIVLDHNRQSRKYKGSRRSIIALERVNSIILSIALITCLLLAKIIGDFLLVYLR